MSAASGYLPAGAARTTALNARAIAAIGVVALGLAAVALLSGVRAARRENELSATAAAGFGAALLVPGLLDAGPVPFVPDLFP